MKTTIGSLFKQMRGKSPFTAVGFGNTRGSWWVLTLQLQLHRSFAGYSFAVQ
jgi:hypothetical protein